MTANRDVFAIDPTTRPIPNDGVAKVAEPRTPAEYDVLRYELSSFVCDGEYRQGMERILSAYLANLSRPAQPAVWVSGFYGSGKSHFVRVLEYLWRDITFPDGATSRGLTRLPQEIGDLLRELSTAGRQHGGLWSAAGTLGAGAGSVRLALLAILFRSAKLPEQFAPARFAIWLQQNNYYTRFEREITAAGKDVFRELNNLYVSPFVARALLAAYPEFAANEAEARSLLRTQYATQSEITDDELLRTIEDVLALQSDTPEKLPLTLLVFDELQQFIGEDPARTLQVQNVVEACSTRFGSTLLFVATGQSALQATPQLSKLQGRFTVRVQLRDTDVEQVVRQVVLRKNPNRVPELDRVLDRASGEISRHLGGTNIAARSADHDALVPDYPLLPTRRRFWEAVLRAVDNAGMAGQLRTQLRIVHEAAQRVAAAPLGTVVAGDFIYGQLKTDMLQNGTLLREMNLLIEELADGTPDGMLRSRLCSLVFLVGKLPADGPSATGVRATAANLADLLVEDLPNGSGDLRQRVPVLLDDLVRRSKLMQLGEEYRLQTRESAEWELDFHNRYQRVYSDDSRLANDRAQELRNAFTVLTRGMSFAQGVSRTKREFELFFGYTMPDANGSVPIWVRDEWSVSESSVRADAQRAGTDSPLLFVFLPRRDADALKSRLAAVAAARETLDARPAPTTPEGIEARNAMHSRAETERRELDALVQRIIAGTRIFSGGGNEISEGSLPLSFRAAIEGAIERLFPDFGMADNANWNRVFERASQGAPDALSAIGYNGEIEQQPVCRLVRQFVGISGKRGTEVRQKFKGAGYGWPQDAIDAALLVLVGAGMLRASRNHQPVRLNDISRSQIGQTEFASEGVTITTGQKIEIRRLLTSMNLSIRPNEELQALPIMLDHLRDLASRAGGPPPLPERPNTGLVDELRGLNGNEQLVAVYDHRTELLELFNTWRAARDHIEARLPEWQQLQRLQRAADSLPAAVPILQQIAAVETNRGLLREPNPLPPLEAALAETLRAALNDAAAQFQTVRDRELAALDAADEWQRLDEHQRQNLVARHNMNETGQPRLGTTEELLHAVETAPPSFYEREAQAFAGRVNAIREEAARLLAPQAVPLRLERRTLNTAEEAEAYLARLRDQVMAEIKAGKPVILQ